MFPCLFAAAQSAAYFTAFAVAVLSAIEPDACPLLLFVAKDVLKELLKDRLKLDLILPF